MNEQAMPSAADAAACVQTLPLSPGIYSFSLQSGSGAGTISRNGIRRDTNQLRLPALHIAEAPVDSSGRVEFLSGPATCERWLIEPDDVVIAKVSGGDVTLMITSLRLPHSPLLSMEVRRLDRSADGVSPIDGPALDVLGAVALEPPIGQQAIRPLSVLVVVHVQNRGDLPFAEVGWAGCKGEKLWIEGFSMKPLERITADSLQYRARNIGGLETPWIGDGQLCGSRGMRTPLAGFAIRLNPRSNYECEYSGSFISGRIVGPLTDGTICSSGFSGDPLDGILIRISERA